MEELIVRVLSGEATELEVRRLEAWRAESAEHERTFAQMERVWQVTGATEADRPVPPAPSVAHIVAQAERRRSKVVSLEGWRVPRLRRWQLIAVAAAAVILLVLGIPRMQRQPTSTFATAAGERRTVTLVDGSIVRLGPESVLEVRGASPRSTRLEGQAFFAVATDPSRPFTVQTPVGETQVLGTRFEIASNADSLRLVVVEGRVALSESGTRVEVARGEVSRVTAGSTPTEPVTADIWALLDWPNGVLIFQATPLAEALEQIERHFGVPFAINDDDLAQRTVTAWFEDESLVDVVNTLCAVVDAQCEVGDIVVVAP